MTDRSTRIVAHGWQSQEADRNVRDALSRHSVKAVSVPVEDAPNGMCTCGRPAIVVYSGLYGDVGSCGIAGAEPVLPCPFCGSEEPHTMSGNIVSCPQYRLHI